VEEVHTVLDEHIVKTQIMKGSPFAKPFALAIKEWQNWLNFLQQLIDVWLKVQAAWYYQTHALHIFQRSLFVFTSVNNRIYLEPVFGAEDISKQMPAEGNMFKSVDSRWRDLMSKVNLNPRVANVTNIPHILGILQVCKTDLDTIQTELNAYLETKRRYFPRFYFLSNDELLVTPTIGFCTVSFASFDGKTHGSYLHNNRQSYQRPKIHCVFNPI
jgi:dynein heavy chain